MGPILPSLVHWLCTRRRLQNPRPATPWTGLEALEPRRLLSSTPVILDVEDIGRVDEGVPVVLRGTFHDLDRNDAHTATIDWGDGVSSTASVRAPIPASTLTIKFDYRLDTFGFFDPTNADGQAARDRLEMAADRVAGAFQDRLDAIRPGGRNSWTALFTHPETQENHQIRNLVVPENQITIFVGAADLPDQLAIGGYGGFRASGSGNWIRTVRARGQTRAIGPNPTDFGPWGGSISFDHNKSWHFGETTSGLETKENDFLSVAVHEITHVLGFGAGADGGPKTSWSRRISGDTFTGAASVSLFGSPVPVSTGHSHWQEGLRSGQPPRPLAMDPGLRTGKRLLLRPLDQAALSDVGWDIDPDAARDGTFSDNHIYTREGFYSVVVILADQSGKLETQTLSVTVDPVPKPAIAVTMDPDSDTGALLDGVTRDDRPAFLVQVNSGGTVRVDWDGDDRQDDAMGVAGAGTYRITPATPLGEGVFSAEVTFENFEGVARDTQTLTIDKTPPRVEQMIPSGRILDPISKILIQFDDGNSLHEAELRNVMHYTLIAAGGDRLFGNGNDFELNSAIREIQFDVTTGTVSLILFEPLPEDAYQLAVASGAVVDLAGNVLLGNEVAGHRYVVSFETSRSIEIGNGGNKKLTIRDADGTTTTMRMIRGFASVRLNGQGLTLSESRRGAVVVGEDVHFADIAVTNTSVGSLLVQSRRGRGSIELRHMTVTGSLRMFRGPTLDLVGDLTVTGSVRRIQLRHARDGTVMIKDEEGSGSRLAMKLENVQDLVFHTNTPMTSLTLNEWIDTNPDLVPDMITVPSLRRLVVRPRRGSGANGAFHAGLRVLGSGALGLGNVHVAGTIGAVTWIVQGRVGRILAGSISSGFSASIAGPLLAITVKGHASGDIAATDIRRAMVVGDLTNARWMAGATFGTDGVVGAAPDTFGAGKFNALTVRGQMRNSLVAAGVAPQGPVDFRSDFKAAVSFVDPESTVIRRISIRGGMDSDSRFIAGGLPRRVRVGTENIDPSTDIRFRTLPNMKEPG